MKDRSWNVVDVEFWNFLLEVLNIKGFAGIVLAPQIILITVRLTQDSVGLQAS